jgi:hypothetical protein
MFQLTIEMASGPIDAVSRLAAGPDTTSVAHAPRRRRAAAQRSSVPVPPSSAAAAVTRRVFPGAIYRASLARDGPDWSRCCGNGLWAGQDTNERVTELFWILDRISTEAAGIRRT